MRSFFVPLLAVLLALVPALPAQASMMPMAAGAAAHGSEMSNCDCADCETGAPDVSDCQFDCQVICSAGIVTALPPLSALRLDRGAMAYRAVPEGRKAGLSPEHNLPPPRI
ncbi:MAG: hypothetical protein CVT83_03480 [Alphaproteobacteria bacterium HGW-Alphaproteobacteria-5]|nr:MAG: hypothetical protein CVT83_03480 [Alphaproteobacteria bacterium HGW-Alphaproteobacteria-5]